ncbi:MAG: glutamate--cysteine ligase [Candidatus Omnitrophota bacterium]
MRNFIEIIKNKQEQIHEWLASHESKTELPLYSSVDIRDASFKVAIVDTNLFPAGFNNLCEHGIEDSVKYMKTALLRRVKNCQNILIVAEEHTRNTWYLENIRILQQIIERAGFKVTVSTFLYIQPEFCEEATCVEFKTATGEPVRICCFQMLLKEIRAGRLHFDLIIMNNDLTSGIPDILKQAQAPIYPSIQAGWHARLKSHHFQYTAELMNEFARIADLDPWFFSCLNLTVDHVNINVDKDRALLADQAGTLLKQIQSKYDEHKIKEKPFIFLKADAGTYGMGVMSFEDPSEILDLNRKNKNKLYKGKSAHIITRYLLQEGVPTIYNINHKVSEVCIYQIENNLVGGFYRSHSDKTTRDNLNAKGMDFVKMCPHLSKYGDCGVHHDVNIFDVYRILARIAAVAAHREIVQLEGAAKQ